MKNSKPKENSGGSEVFAGVAWYRKDQWNLLRRESVDKDELEDTYEKWLRSAEKGIRNLMKAGADSIERVEIDVLDLIAWCEENARPIDASARAEYTARQLHKKHTQNGSPRDPVHPS